MAAIGADGEGDETGDVEEEDGGVSVLMASGVASSPQSTVIAEFELFSEVDDVSSAAWVASMSFCIAVRV